MASSSSNISFDASKHAFTRRSATFSPTPNARYLLPTKGLPSLTESDALILMPRAAMLYGLSGRRILSTIWQPVSLYLATGRRRTSQKRLSMTECSGVDVGRSSYANDTRVSRERRRGKDCLTGSSF